MSLKGRFPVRRVISVIKTSCLRFIQIVIINKFNVLSQQMFWLNAEVKFWLFIFGRIVSPNIFVFQELVIVLIPLVLGTNSRFAEGKSFSEFTIFLIKQSLFKYSLVGIECISLFLLLAVLALTNQRAVYNAAIKNLFLFSIIHISIALLAGS